MEESFASGKLVVDSSKRMNIMAVHWVFILDTSKMAAVLSESQSNHLVRIGEQEGWFCKVGG